MLAPEQASQPNDVESLKAHVVPHPLDQLSSHEIHITREVIQKARGSCLILFRAIFTREPLKAQLIPFLEAEHSATLSSSTPRPPREALVQYDIIHNDRSHEYMESVVDTTKGLEVGHRIVDEKHQSALTLYVADYDPCDRADLS